jgi:hypothetical protein
LAKSSSKLNLTMFSILELLLVFLEKSASLILRTARPTSAARALLFCPPSAEVFSSNFFVLFYELRPFFTNNYYTFFSLVDLAWLDRINIFDFAIK